MFEDNVLFFKVRPRAIAEDGQATDASGLYKIDAERSNLILIRSLM